LVLSDGKDLKIFPNKAKPEMTIAGCIEYIYLAKRIQKGIFGPFSIEEEKDFIEEAKRIILEIKI